MELLVPGIWIILGAVAVVFGIIPRLGPTIVLLVAAGLLTVGIYHHYTLFHNEYRLATWADKLKTYGPAVMIGVMVLFILGFIFTLFGGMSVPLPSMENSAAAADELEDETPEPTPTPTPTDETPLETIVNTMKEGAQAVGNVATAAANKVTNIAGNVRQNIGAAFNNRNKVRFNMNNYGNTGNTRNRNRNQNSNQNSNQNMNLSQL